MTAGRRDLIVSTCACGSEFRFEGESIYGGYRYREWLAEHRGHFAISERLERAWEQGQAAGLNDAQLTEDDDFSENPYAATHLPE